MTRIYDVIAREHSHRNVVLFYDENRESAIEYMRKYVKQYGFSKTSNKGTESIADIVLREREATGTVISETPYIELFDV